MTAKAFPRKKRPYMFAMTPTVNALYARWIVSQATRNRKSEEHRPNCGTDLALIWEPSADKVVRDPTNTSNCHEDGLLSGS